MRLVSQISVVGWHCLLCFFQAEDGIRDIGVTGVQTCALPICRRSCRGSCGRRRVVGVVIDGPIADPQAERAEMADGANRSGGVGDDPAPQEASREASPRAFGSLSDEERKRLLTRKVFELTRENRAALRSQTDFEAALIRGKATNHLLMFVTLAAILVGGLFAMAWLVMALTGGEEIERLTIDRQGAIASAKSGRSVDARGDFIRIAGPTIVLVMAP